MPAAKRSTTTSTPDRTQMRKKRPHVLTEGPLHSRAGLGPRAYAWGSTILSRCGIVLADLAHQRVRVVGDLRGLVAGDAALLPHPAEAPERFGQRGERRRRAD